MPNTEKIEGTRIKMLSGLTSEVTRTERHESLLYHGRLDRLVGRQDDYNMAEHYRELMERHLAQSNFYQGLLYHAWKCNRQQTKGLRRQATKIKRLKQRIAELTPNAGLEPGN